MGGAGISALMFGNCAKPSVENVVAAAIDAAENNDVKYFFDTAIVTFKVAG